MATEKPRYEILEKDGNIELRKYDGYITASLEVKADSYSAAGNKSFRSLADFIFGNNTKDVQIAMTAPVISEKANTSVEIAMTVPLTTSREKNDRYVISFTMPSSYSLEDLPKPKNNKVIIKTVSSHEVVAIRFSGYTDDKTIEKMAHELREWAHKKRIEIASEPTVFRYDAPWKPGFMRRNEVCFRVI